MQIFDPLFHDTLLPPFHSSKEYVVFCSVCYYFEK